MAKEVSIHADPPPALVCEPKDFQYETGDQLGKGGFAICHKATLIDKGKRTGRIVALKIVKSKMEPQKLAQKFVTELQLHSKLHHPNIVEFHRAFSYQVNTYVVLEICDNGSLADAIKKRKFFTMPEIRRFVIQTCGAVKYLHTRNIVHRDLKTGNLFLDKDMNIKVGDFGLAALLVTENDIGKRRTTMCGTPNYLAPEILEKGGKGHNEKVDLWSIGIIAYTLAVGKAPFHAPKREDIYKKLQAREYKWPELSSSPNDISNDLRDLVGGLLVHEDDRPGPDDIVSHAFFKMTFIPEQLDSKYTREVPKWPYLKPPNAETIRRGYTDTWFTLCQASGVGEYAPGKTFQVFGGKKVRSVVRDCEKELAAGRQPIVPIPQSMVYVPFPEQSSWPKEMPRPRILEQIVEATELPSESAALLETTGNDRVGAPPRRAASRAKRQVSVKENINANREDAEALSGDAARTRKVSRTRAQPDPKPLNAPAVTRGGAKSSLGAVETEPIVLPMRTASGATRKASQRIASGAAARTRRVDSGVSVALSEARVLKEVEIINLTDSEPSADPGQEDGFVDIETPAIVLARVEKLRDNIAKALSNKGTAPRRAARPPKMPFIAKWVDYARKYGIGYVLEDGSIGASMNATASSPIVHMVVKNGFARLQEIVNNVDELDRLPMESYEDQGEAGLVPVVLDEERRRSGSILWAKFGKYMCQQLGQYRKAEKGSTSTKPATYVKFYQRIGGVGIWGFSDGCFQLNFPDHTKIVISPDGRCCDFTYLPPIAVAHMKKYGEVPPRYMKDRAVLSQSIAVLLSADPDDGAEGTFVRANQLRLKLKFIACLADEWVRNGGLGRVSPSSERLEWKGIDLEKGRKTDTVTLGRSGGDAHVVRA